MAAPVDDGRFDAVFLGIAQQSPGIDAILGSFFGFLRRKTDFFSQQDRAMSVLTRHVQIQSDLYAREMAAAPPPAPAPAPKRAPAPAPAPVPVPAPAPVPKFEILPDDAPPAPAPVSGGAAAESGPVTDIPDEEDKSDPKKKPNAGNGGDTDNYTWQQTLEDVTVYFPIPAGVKARDITCDITATHIKFGLKGRPPVVDAALPKRVQRDDCTWTLDSDSHVVTVFLQKEGKMEWWKNIAEGEPDIDTTKVQPENSKLSDLDGSSRQLVEKMMFDQRQKALGLPTSEEMQKQDIMKKFMAQHPEMDFSNAKFN